MTCDRYQGLSGEEQNKREYARKRYQNMSEEDKQKFKGHKKNQICSRSQEELQHQLEQILVQISKL